MVKISALSAWAELRIASATQKFLVAVVEPHKQKLNKLWVGALKDYALMRVDSDSSMGPSNVGPLEMTQSGLGKEVLLPVSDVLPDPTETSLTINSAVCSTLSVLPCRYSKHWQWP